MSFLPSQEWCKYGMLLEKGPLNAVQLLMRPLSVLENNRYAFASEPGSKS